eukprot:364493-Chlamydomonas_euryale.AAC.8
MRWPIPCHHPSVYSAGCRSARSKGRELVCGQLTLDGLRRMALSRGSVLAAIPCPCHIQLCFAT